MGDFRPGTWLVLMKHHWGLPAWPPSDLAPWLGPRATGAAHTAHLPEPTGHETAKCLQEVKTGYEPAGTSWWEMGREAASPNRKLPNQVAPEPGPSSAAALPVACGGARV